MPIFNGEGPDAWIFRAKRYFNINQFMDWQKIEAATICFEGKELTWYQPKNG